MRPAPSRTRLLVLAGGLACVAVLKITDSAGGPDRIIPVQLGARSVALQSTEAGRKRAQVLEPNTQVALNAHGAIRMRGLLNEDGPDVFAPLTEPPAPAAGVAKGASPAALGTQPIIVTPPVAPVPAPPPTPRFPYAVIGYFEQNGTRTVFLAAAQNTLAVHTGDQLDTGWTIQDIQVQQMTVVHRTVNQSMMIDLVAASSGFK